SSNKEFPSRATGRKPCRGPTPRHGPGHQHSTISNYVMTKSARKITFIGAGSTVFAKNLIGDILSFPELADSTVCLYDIAETRLKSSEIVAKRIATTLGAPSNIEVT